MKNNHNELSSGNKSTNFQARDNVNFHQTNNNFGVSAGEARHIALDVFKANFYELSEKANAIAIKRAEELVDNFLSKIERENPILLKKIQDPDVQYAVLNAQRQYARSGDIKTLELLTQLLKNRFQSNSGSLKSIVLNESIEVLPKLTIDHVSIITTLFLVKNCQLSSVRHLIENLNKIMPDKILELKRDVSFFEHLMYAGITTNDVTLLNGQKLEYFIRKNYSGELVEKVEGNTLDILDPPVRKQFITDSLSESVFEKWNNSILKNYTVTSVGKAIAIAQYNSIMNTQIALDIWIKG